MFIRDFQRNVDFNYTVFCGCERDRRVYQGLSTERGLQPQKLPARTEPPMGVYQGLSTERGLQQGHQGDTIRRSVSLSGTFNGTWTSTLVRLHKFLMHHSVYQGLSTERGLQPCWFDAISFCSKVYQGLSAERGLQLLT